MKHIYRKRLDEALIAAMSVAFAALLIADIALGDGLPDPGMDIVPGKTALVITDPQNDFLSPDGVTWGVVGKSVEENRTVENIESLLYSSADS